MVVTRWPLPADPLTVFSACRGEMGVVGGLQPEATGGRGDDQRIKRFPAVELLGAVKLMGGVCGNLRAQSVGAREMLHAPALDINLSILRL